MAGTLQVDPPDGANAAPADDPAARVGTMIAGRYALGRVLGTGGMGAVYEAENTWTGRKVAVKVMLPGAAKAATAPERFLREARAATKVEHPHIVEVLDAGQNAADGSLYIVQELLHGTDLRALFSARSRLPWPELFALVGPVMDALAAAHRRGIVHRDVKPENIFLVESRETRTPKLIDFGIARLLDDDGALHLTQSGALMGTPYYMSPEQARGRRDVDARADVWAMAVVIREGLAGERPFRGGNYNALLVAILSEPIAPTRDVAADVPPRAAAAIDRALARDPDGRFRDMGEFLDALRAEAVDPMARTPLGLSVPAPRAPSRARAPVALALAALGVVAGVLALQRARHAPSVRAAASSPAALSLSAAPPAPTPLPAPTPAPLLAPAAPPAPAVAPVAQTRAPLRRPARRPQTGLMRNVRAR